jgi:lipoprotein-anchoring transpeptidase ErfK/SrfK
VTESQLAAEYPTIITIDRSAFELRLWKHLRLVKTYPIAVGMVGLETPAGLYHVQDKQVDPSWDVPNSPWAGSLAGQVIPLRSADPLKARWMGIFKGAAIHGMDPSEYGTIGHNASHGCIRMTIPDVIELYNQTPVGAPVYIA